MSLCASQRAKAIVESLGGIWRGSLGECRCPTHMEHRRVGREAQRRTDQPKGAAFLAARIDVRASARAGARVRAGGICLQAYVLHRVDRFTKAAQPAEGQNRVLYPKIRRVEKRVRTVDKVRGRVEIAERLGLHSAQVTGTNPLQVQSISVTIVRGLLIWTIVLLRTYEVSWHKAR